MAQTLIYPQTFAIKPPQGSDGPPETQIPLLQLIAYLLGSGATGGGGSSGSGVVIVNGVAIPFDARVFTYYDSGATNIQTITYKQGGTGGTTVGVDTFAYIQNPVTTANASIQAIATTAS